MEGSALAGPGVHVLTYSPILSYNPQRAGLIVGMQKKRPGGEGNSVGPKEGMMRCLAHRSALRDKQKQGEEGNLSLAGSQYSERRWRPYVRPVAVL